MERPRKKEILTREQIAEAVFEGECCIAHKIRIHNQACGDWEAYIKAHYIAKDSLPDEQELMDIIHQSELCQSANKNVDWPIRRERKSQLAQAIITARDKKRG